MRRALWSIGVLCVLPCIGGAVRAQPPATPTFEAASVKANTSGDGRTGGVLVGGRFSMTNETLWRLVGEAYATSEALARFQIVGGPDWINTDRFDVEAVAQSPLAREQARLMLRALLSERFKLAAHTERRDLPVYALVAARTDGKLGPQLRRSTTDCAAPADRPQPQAPNQPAPCVMGFGFGRLAANGLTISQLATVGLSRAVGRIVVDRTNLTGPFDWTLVWTPDNLPPRAPGTPADQPLLVNGIAIDPNGPPLFTALQEQLGLKLEPTRGPVEVLVIDRVEHPTEN